MKSMARTLSEKKARTLIKEEFEKRYEELFNSARKDLSAQLMAVVLVTLDKTYGFKGKRLKRFIQDVEANFKLIIDNSFATKTDTQTYIDYIKDKYGIDLDEEIKICE